MIMILDLEPCISLELSLSQQYNDTNKTNKTPWNLLMTHTIKYLSIHETSLNFVEFARF